MTDISDESLPEWTDEELRVLRSADGDAPPARSLSATLAAVGVGGALASGAAAAKGAAVAGSVGSAVTTAKWGSLVAISKWIGVIAVGGAVIGSGVVLLRRAERAHAAAAPSTVAPVQPQHDVSHEALVVPSSDPVVQASPDAAEAEAPEAVAKSLERRAATRTQPDISLEIAALDEARTALRGGRTAEALTALDRYDAKFARAGSLRVEATALRIEALLRAGNRARATSLASTFLARNPKSPYAARVRALSASRAQGPSAAGGSVPPPP